MEISTDMASVIDSARALQGCRRLGILPLLCDVRCDYCTCTASCARSLDVAGPWQIPSQMT